MTTDLDLRLYHDGYKEWIEALIASKMKGEVAQVKEEKPAARSIMEMHRETAESFRSSLETIMRKSKNHFRHEICISTIYRHLPR